MSLKQDILNTLAKTYKHHKKLGGGGGWNTFRNFAEMEEYYLPITPYYTDRIKKNVELVLSIKQKEVERIIDEMIEGWEHLEHMGYADVKQIKDKVSILKELKEAEKQSCEDVGKNPHPHFKPKEAEK